jgi:DNA-directed RNA polymerase subunit N (RpoN/RPB10)
MLVPVQCFTCGCCIGHVARLYRAIRRARVEKALKATRGGKTLPQVAALDMEMSMDMEDVMDKLRLYDCCRARLATAMVYSDYY